jgi:hypothetical protein
MEIKYDEATGDLLIIFSHEKPSKSIRIDQDTILWQADSGKYVYMQIGKASKHVDNPRGIQFDIISKDAPPAGYIVVGGDDAE